MRDEDGRLRPWAWRVGLIAWAFASGGIDERLPFHLPFYVTGLLAYLIFRLIEGPPR
jgi:hypothetical protein